MTQKWLHLKNYNELCETLDNWIPLYRKNKTSISSHTSGLQRLKMLITYPEIKNPDKTEDGEIIY